MGDLSLLCGAASCVYGARTALQWRDSSCRSLLSSRILHAEPDGTFTFVHMERHTASAYDGKLRLLLQTLFLNTEVCSNSKFEVQNL